MRKGWPRRAASVASPRVAKEATASENRYEEEGQRCPNNTRQGAAGLRGGQGKEGPMSRRSPDRAPREASGGATAAALEDAMRLFELLYGDGTGFVGLFSALRTAPGMKRTIVNRSAFFAHPGEVETIARWCLSEAARGREAYFCPHLLLDRRRIKENAAPVAALWADFDGGREANIDGAPEPTAVVETSPGKRHMFWRLRRPVSPPEAEALNRRLARALGADPSGWDLSQLLRPPGTRNRKYDGAPPVSLVGLDEGATYNPRELELCLPHEETSARRPDTVRRSEAARQDVPPTAAVDLSRLTQKMRDLITHGDAGLYRSRSEADFAACLAMFGAGYAEEEVWAVMTEPSYGVSGKYLDKGCHGHSYMALTIGKAKATATPARMQGTTRRRRHGANTRRKSHRRSSKSPS